MNTQGPTEIFAERLAAQTRQHSATDPHLIACHFTAGWLAAVDALNARQLAQDFAPTQAPTPQPDADGWTTHNYGDPMPCAEDLLVDVIFADGEEARNKSAKFWNEGTCNWDYQAGPRSPIQIAKWRPARSRPKSMPQPQP